MDALDDLFGNDDHPLHWQGHYVYIRSIESVGFVSASQQNGRPSEATITVTLAEDDGSWSNRGIKRVLGMAEAAEDLVPDIRCLIEEPP